MFVFDVIAKFFLIFANQFFLLAIILPGLAIKEREFITPTCLLLLTAILSATLKLAFGIPYPPELVAKLGKNGFSFPSGHMQSTAVFYGWFLLKSNKNYLRYLLLMTIAGVGFGLIYEGYHDIIDVIGGILFACITIALFEFIFTTLGKKQNLFSQSALSFIISGFVSVILMIGLIISHQVKVHLIVTNIAIICLGAVFFYRNYQSKRLQRNTKKQF